MIENKLLVDDSLDQIISNSTYFKHYIKFDTIDSTNNYAMKNCALGRINPGTLILTNHQTQGRGRLNNQWESTSGNDLLFSMVIKPKVPVIKWPQIGIIMAKTLHRSLHSFIPKTHSLTIKWPNDILLNNKKIAGILCTTENKCKLLVIGIGINVNSNWTKHTDRCSLKDSLKHQINCMDILNNIITTTDKNIEAILTSAINHSKWNEIAAYVGQKVHVLCNGENLLGTFLGIDNNGAALLKNEANKIVPITNGTHFRLIH